MPATASPVVSSTVGLKNMVIAPLTVDTETTITYGALQLVAGAGDHQQQEGVDHAGDGDLGLSYADGLDDDRVEPGGLHDQHALAGGPRHAAQVARKLSPAPKPVSSTVKRSRRCQRSGRSLPAMNTCRAWPSVSSGE